MDIQKSFALLVSWFKTSDNFVFSKHFRQLNWKLLGEENKTLNDEEARICLEIALKDMLENKMLKVSEQGTGKAKENFYVIVESLRNSPEELSLSKQTCDNIRKVVSGVLPMISFDYNYDDKADVSEEHILLILECINVLAKQLEELRGEKKKTQDDTNKSEENS